MEKRKVGKFIEKLINVLKGIIMGVANVIPGVSGGTLAVILNIYDKMIEAISSIFKTFVKSVLYLLPIGIGMLIGILSSAVAVDKCLDLFPLATILLFVGMILGGIPMLFKKVEKHMKSVPNIIIFAVIFIAFIAYSLLCQNKTVEVTVIYWYHYLLFFVLGVVAAATMIIPGISGSLTLMALGYYELIVGECVGNIFDFSQFVYHIQVLIPFAIGCAVGIILISKLVNFLLKKFEVKTYFGILGFVFASIIVIFPKNLTGYDFTSNQFIVELIVGIGLLFIGFSLAYSIANEGIYIGIWKIFKKSHVEKISSNEEAKK